MGLLVDAQKILNALLIKIGTLDENCLTDCVLDMIEMDAPLNNCLAVIITIDIYALRLLRSLLIVSAAHLRESKTLKICAAHMPRPANSSNRDFTKLITRLINWAIKANP